MSRSLQFLIVVVIAEFVVIICLLTQRLQVRVVPGIQRKVSPLVANRLYGGLEYETPETNFDALIKDFPRGVNFIPPGETNSILSKCAEAGREGYVRSLISNGADVELAVKEAELKHDEGAVQLIRRVQSEIRKEPPRE